MAGDHQAGVENAAERPAGAFHLVDRWHEDLFFDLRFESLGNEGRWAVGAHAARVGAFVAVKCGLMVLAGGHRDQRHAVGEGEHACFLAVQSFFDDELSARFTEFALHRDAIDSGKCLLAIVAHEHAFAGGEAVGFDDDGDVVAVFQKRHGRLCALKNAEFGRGNIGVPEQVLRKDFAGLQFGGRLGRAERPLASGLQRIHDAGGEGRFGADDGEADLILLCELDETGDVGRRDVDIFGLDGRAGITGGNKHAAGGGLWASFHAKACSRPPLPTTRIFIPKSRECTVTKILRTAWCWWKAARRDNDWTT